MHGNCQGPSAINRREYDWTIACLTLFKTRCYSPPSFKARKREQVFTVGSAVNLSKTYHFRIAGQRVTLYKKNGESYEHVLMKALGYAMFRPQFPNLEIERRIGLRYKPDLVALNPLGKAEFWGECGQVALRKVGWIAKHSGARKLVLFKFNIVAEPFVTQVRQELDSRYRPPERIRLYNFNPVVLAEAGEAFDCIPLDWYEKFDI